MCQHMQLILRIKQNLSFRKKRDGSKRKLTSHEQYFFKKVKIIIGVDGEENGKNIKIIETMKVKL